MPPARRRSALATWLAVLGGVAIALGIAGTWAQRTLGDPASVAALAGDILERPEVRTELAIVIVDPALEELPDVVRDRRTLLVTTTAAALGTSRFVPVFEDVLRGAATRLVEGRGAVRLELDRPIAEVAAELEPVAPELAAQLAAIDPPAPEVVSARDADRLRAIIGLARATAIALLVAGALLVVVAVVLAGAWALMPFGATFAGASLLLFGALLFGRTILLAAIEPPGRAEAAEATWNVVVADLRTALLVGAATGAVALVIGGVLSRRR